MKCLFYLKLEKPVEAWSKIWKQSTEHKARQCSEFWRCCMQNCKQHASEARQGYIDDFMESARVRYLRTSCWRIVQIFLLCSSWMYFLMTVINLFELCLWFMANFRENLSKLVETLQISVNEDWRGSKNNVNAFANWLIHPHSWFLIGWNSFSHVWESRFAIVIGWRNFRMSFWLYPKISVSMN